MFWKQISANKRATALLVFFMGLLLAATASAFVFLYERNFWWVGAAGAVLFTLIYAAFLSTGGSRSVLTMVGARRATHEEDQVLVNVGEEMAIAAGIPMPEVWVIDDSSPNAFATGWHPRKAAVCFTTGILKKLDRDELQGVMAHELAHIRNYDTRLMLTLALTVGILVMLRDSFLRSTRGSRRDSKSGGTGALAIFAILLIILAPLFAVLLKMAVSRKREYLADASAVQFTRNPNGLASALVKIASDPDPLEAGNHAVEHMFIVNPFDKMSAAINGLFSTHPPISQRVLRLKEMGATIAPEKKEFEGMPEIPVRRPDPD